MSAFTVRAFQTPKAGSEPEACEDAVGWDADQQLFAIADGATDSAFQKLWANELVNGFLHHPPESFFRPALETWFADWLIARQGQWRANIDWANLPWHGFNKARQTGGLATFLGLRLLPHQPHWHGLAVGDCNLFQLFRNGDIYDYQPATLASEFNSNPIALSSLQPQPQTLFPHLQRLGGTYYPGETLLLTTDALAVWLLQQIEANARPWPRLLALENPADFNTWVEGLRRDQQIRNDDTSLLVIRI